MSDSSASESTSFIDIWWRVTLYTCLAVSGTYFLTSFWAFRGFKFRGLSTLFLPFAFAIAGFVIAFFGASILAAGVAGMYTSNKASLTVYELAIFVIIFSFANLFFAVGGEWSIRIL
eukprot:ANDGO_02981.mRNA.1 hypothetical protein